jgi:murein DD-endopeptidase MepM/ murein hydrolase activator NlpD
LSTVAYSPIIDEGVISSPWGYRKDPFTGKKRFHKGVDISTGGRALPLYAPFPAKVKIGKNRASGNYIKFMLANGHASFSHLSKFTVSDGEYVEAGQRIGYVGKTGRATGLHVHVALWLRTIEIDGETGKVKNVTALKAYDPSVIVEIRSKYAMLVPMRR